MHHLRAWSLDGEHHVFSAHVVMASGTGRQEILDLKRWVRAELDGEEFEHVTLDVELKGEDCVAPASDD